MSGRHTRGLERWSVRFHSFRTKPRSINIPALVDDRGQSLIVDTCQTPKCLVRNRRPGLQNRVHGRLVSGGLFVSCCILL
jgi:hypothetical protein